MFFLKISLKMLFFKCAFIRKSELYQIFKRRIYSKFFNQLKTFQSKFMETSLTILPFQKRVNTYKYVHATCNYWLAFYYLGHYFVGSKQFAVKRHILHNRFRIVYFEMFLVLINYKLQLTKSSYTYVCI